MFVIKNYVTTGGTIACALAIGFLMQSESPAPTEDIVQSLPTDQSSVLAGLEDIVLTSLSSARDTGGAPSSVNSIVQTSRSSPSGLLDCTLSARAKAVPGAAAQLSVKAPCHGNTRIDVHHSGLTVTQVTDETGTLEMTLPALSEYAIFLLSVDDQTGTVATTHIPDMDQFSRVALQWQGNADLQIHALEFGASYGAHGHVSGSPASQGAGHVTRLGDFNLNDAQNVEIYSFPTDQADRSGTITMTVEAEVTQANCGHQLDVRTLALRDDRRLRTQEISFAMPDCDQIGGFLVLNNLLQDLTIAAK